MESRNAVWKEKVKGFLSPKNIEHEVQGELQNFYPLSTKVLFRLRGLTGPLAGAISTLFEDGEKDQGQVHREFSASDGEGGGAETQILPITPELAQMRTSSRERAVRALIDAITDTKNKIIIGLIVCDSMRDVFPRGMTDDDVCEFVDDDELTMDVVVEMVTGVVKANKRVFGPLGDKVSGMMGKATETALANAKAEVDRVAVQEITQEELTES